MGGPDALFTKENFFFILIFGIFVFIFCVEGALYGASSFFDSMIKQTFDYMMLPLREQPAG